MLQRKDGRIQSRDKHQSHDRVLQGMLRDIEREQRLAEAPSVLLELCRKCGFRHSKGKCLHVKIVPPGFSFLDERTGILIGSMIRNTTAPERAKIRNAEQRATMIEAGHLPPKLKKRP